MKLLLLALLLVGYAHAGIMYVANDAHCIQNAIIDNNGKLRESRECPDRMTVSIIIPDSYKPGVRYDTGPAPIINIPLFEYPFGNGMWWSFTFWEQGGAIAVSFNNAGFCCDWTTSHYQEGEYWGFDEDSWVGFRYVDYTLGTLRRVSEPSTLILLAIAGLFIRRRLTP